METTLIVLLILLGALVQFAGLDVNMINIVRILIFGVIAFLAISKEQKYRIKEKDLVDIKEELDRTNEITKMLLTTFSLNDILKMIMDNLTRELGFDLAFIYLLEGSTTTGILRCIATKGAISLKGIDRFTLSFFTEEETLVSVLNTRKMRVIQNVGKEKIKTSGLLDSLKLQQLVLVPMESQGKVNGLVIIGNAIFKKTITEKELTPISIVVNQAGIAIQNAQMYQKIQDLTVIDELTQVHNHRYFQQTIRKEIDSAQRYSQPLSLAIIDIDHFKHYNDTNGHVAGDSVLRQVANILSQGLRRTDTVARYGGEEFALILPATNRDGAIIVLEKLRRDIESYPFPNAEKQPLGKVSISIGIATFPDDAGNVRDLVELSDKGLYIAKNKGRNQVCIYSQIN